MYAPSNILYEGIRRAFPLEMFPWDQYFATMAEADVKNGSQDVWAVKSFFIRQTPFGGGYALLGGITETLRTIEELDLADPDLLDGMAAMGHGPEFIGYLRSERRLKVKVYAPPEGSAFFPNEPIVSVAGPLPQVRLAEGAFKRLNFNSLSLTKWYRLVRAVRPGAVLDFSPRRAQDPLRSSLNAMLAGCERTSYAELRRFWDVPVAGTTGHEWTQRYGDVALAFDQWLTAMPGRPIGLVDTLQCMKHDFPLWLDAVWRHRDRIKAASPAIWGWRNDSGVLEYLALEQYRRFLAHPLAQDPFFRERARIILTNDLDEYEAARIIREITIQSGQAGNDAKDILSRIIWAAGTKPGTCADQPSLGGVAKLTEADGQACLKLALDKEGKPGPKTSIPGFNRSAWLYGEDDELWGVLVFPQRVYDINAQGRLVRRKDGQALEQLEACHPDDPTASQGFRRYRLVLKQRLALDTTGTTPAVPGNWKQESIAAIRERAQKEVDRLHWTMTGNKSEYPLKLSLTKDLFKLRQRMIAQRVLREDRLRRC